MAGRDDIEALMARIQLRDRAALAALYGATSAKLFGVALRILTDRSEAEDALQEIYLKVWDRADRYQVTGHSPMTWLITVARNHAIDRLRARGTRTQPLEAASPVAAAGPGPEAQTIMADEARAIAACLDELPQDRAAAVRGAYLEGATYAQLAVRHDVPLNTMRTWLRRSLIALRECLSR